jgi:hypothetical protein
MPEAENESEHHQRLYPLLQLASKEWGNKDPARLPGDRLQEYEAAAGD